MKPTYKPHSSQKAEKAEIIYISAVYTLCDLLPPARPHLRLIPSYQYYNHIRDTLATSMDETRALGS